MTAHFVVGTHPGGDDVPQHVQEDHVGRRGEALVLSPAAAAVHAAAARRQGSVGTLSTQVLQAAGDRGIPPREAAARRWWTPDDDPFGRP